MEGTRRVEAMRRMSRAGGGEARRGERRRVEGGEWVVEFNWNTSFHRPVYSCIWYREMGMHA